MIVGFDMRILHAALFACAIFLGILLCLRVGWRLGRARLRARGEESVSGLGAIESSVYALMGLLIAFTFTGAAERFEHRRDLIVQEVNAIGTAWLRLDLLDAKTRQETRELFRQYLDARLATYADVTDNAAVAAALAKAAACQNLIWSRLSTAAMQDPSPRTASAVLPPANEMFDLANTRLLAIRQHPPMLIYGMLGLLVLVAGLLAGFGMSTANNQSTLHVIGFAAIVSVAIYLILDLEFPRLGLIRVDDFDQALLELRRSMQ